MMTDSHGAPVSAHNPSVMHIFIDTCNFLLYMIVCLLEYPVLQTYICLVCLGVMNADVFEMKVRVVIVQKICEWNLIVSLLPFV